VKIKDIETVLLSCPVPEEKTWRLDGRKGVKADMVIVKVHTDEGITGIGEPSPYGGALNLRLTIEQLKQGFTGRDPFDVELLTAPTGSRVESMAMAGINMALWDIMGKAVNKPVYRLLGGAYTNRVRAYASGGINWVWFKHPEVLAEEIRGYLDEGFTAFKIRIGPDKRFLDAIRVARETLGDGMDLMVEGNMRFNTSEQAIAMARRFERYNPFWFEEPIPGNNIEGYVEIRKALPQIPITGGESLCTRFEFKERIDRRAYSIVQPDSNYAGLSEARRIAFMASLEGLPCCPHNWHNAVTTAANLQLVASIPNHMVLEMQRTWHYSCPAFRSEIVVNPSEPKNGYLEVPKEPGLGVELDDRALAKYPFREGPIWVPL